MSYEMPKPAYAFLAAPWCFPVHSIWKPLSCCVRPQLPVNQGLCEGKSGGQIALYPQCTAQGSANRGMLERSLLPARPLCEQS